MRKLNRDEVLNILEGSIIIDGHSDMPADIAEKSLEDEVIRLRNHPSIVDWLYGSDKYPPADIEKRYISVLDTYDGTRPYQSSATSASSDIAGPTGLKMTGPYVYVLPSYYYTHNSGGAWGKLKR
jgi:exo-1,4-beta-D-glucosaminidase